MISTCCIIKLWLMWSTSHWLQHPKRVFKKHINDMLSWKILIMMDNVYKGFSFIVCFTIVTLILIVTFRPHTAGLHHRLRVKHDRDIWLSRTQTSAVSEHANKTRHYLLWDEVKFIDQDPHWYSRRVKKAIQIRLHPNNINRDSGIEIPEAWMFKIRQHDNRPLPQRSAEGSVSSSPKANNALDRNPPTTSKVCHTPITNNHGTVVQIVWLSKSILSPDEDLQCAVETSRSISKWQPWDKL